ncbi:MAG: hypothetical protein ACHBN1_33370 [Heteroscytonema crispum UTEX LB 1556]
MLTQSPPSGGLGRGRPAWDLQGRVRLTFRSSCVNPDFGRDRAQRHNNL